MANDSITAGGDYHHVNGEKSGMTVKSPLAEQPLDVKKGGNGTMVYNRESHSYNRTAHRKCSQSCQPIFRLADQYLRNYRVRNAYEHDE